MVIDDENKVVWCSEELLRWYQSFTKLDNNTKIKANRIHHFAKVGFNSGLTRLSGKQIAYSEWSSSVKERNNEKFFLISAILNDYEFKLEQPQKYYWRKKKEYLAWFEEDAIYLNFTIHDEETFLSNKATDLIYKTKFTEQEARDLLKNDFDMFEKVECEQS